ncbi:hypothetical protein HHI36_008036 [Cryptolaemus montrouzieri]|uniref:Cationic amino acid transporter C-terminal domain-containing protein n=1 Tax=Cryptolaemus montrouzieri TaxID=559131 RepID=A0ABD2MRE2_9CUCU
MLFNLNNNKHASLHTAILTKWTIGFFSVLAIIICSFFVFAVDKLTPTEPLFFIPFIFIAMISLMCLLILGRQPVDEINLAFKVPWVPFIPCLSIIINFYLMLELDAETWVRFIVWLVIGFLIYFFYGIKHSREGQMQEKELEISLSVSKPHYDSSKLPNIPNIRILV